MGGFTEPLGHTQSSVLRVRRLSQTKMLAFCPLSLRRPSDALKRTSKWWSLYCDTPFRPFPLPVRVRVRVSGSRLCFLFYLWTTIFWFCVYFAFGGNIEGLMDAGMDHTTYNTHTQLFVRDGHCFEAGHVDRCCCISGCWSCRIRL